MAIRINQIIKEKNIPNICLLHGAERYLVRQFRDKLIDELLPSRDPMNFSRFISKTGTVEEANNIFEEMSDIANTYPVFSDKRVILCENTGFFKNKFDGFSDFLKAIPEQTYLIFAESNISKATSAYKTAGKIGFVEEYEMPDRSSLAKWVTGKLKSFSLTIDRDALVEFIDRTSFNMDNMDKELEKLASYCMDRENITLRDVQNICIATYEEQIFNIINAIAKKDKKTAMKEYAYLYQLRTSPRAILALLTKKFSQILSISMGQKQGLDNRLMAKNLGIKSDYAMKKTLESVRYFDEAFLKKILNLSAEYHKKMNTGLLNEQTGIEMFILNCLND